MNIKSLTNSLKGLIPGLLIILLMLSFSSCSRKLVFATSVVVPAAEGTVSIRKDRNKNYSIKVQISDLAEVSRLQGSKLTYVVWMVSGNDKTENLGQLKSSRTFLTNQLKATLNTVSSSNPGKVFITSENDGGTQYPIGQIILSTSSF